MLKIYLKVLGLIIINSLIFNYSPNTLAEENNLTQVNQCPRDLETLTAQLLNDLPHYANRVIQRARRLERSQDNYYTVIVAGKGEFEPLELSNTDYIPFSGEQPQQLFFTTLERTYETDRIVLMQSYHWLFLTTTDLGWQTVMMFSANGPNLNNLPLYPPTPPRETSDSFIGQGVKIWLRDCNAR
jgi:hypothetical protein